jgi:NAD(P)-dependent dehydrogenase (short-subunit alcohol dehydrogenase family)
MSGRLEGKRTIVTGGASGIGKACVARFLDEGARVAALDQNEAGLKEWDDPDGGRSRAWTLDVSSSAEVTGVVGEAVEWLGGCDVLVNAAGITTSGDALELSEADFDRVMDVNVKGSFLCAQVAGRAMRDSGQGGSIVNISSVSAELANPHHVHYSTSKGAVRMLTKALAVALAPHNIRVNAVGPGPVLTAMGQSEIYERDPDHMNRLLGRVLRGRVGAPEDIAAAVLFLASDEADFVNGTTLYADGGVLAVR